MAEATSQARLPKVSRRQAQRMKKAELVDALLREQDKEATVIIGASPLLEIKSLVNYRQFFPQVDQEKKDVVLEPFGTAILPEEMETEAGIRRAVARGTITEPHEVRKPTLPEIRLAPPEELKLVRAEDNQAVEQILAGNEIGKRYVDLVPPKTLAGQRNVTFLKERLLPILQLAKHYDDEKPQLEPDFRELLHKRIKQIEAM